MHPRKSARSTLFVALAVATIMLISTAAVAHPVNQFGNPNCFGDRISHGASSGNAHNGHELTPVDRVALLQQFIVDPILADGTPEEKALVMELFGETVSVQEFIRFVRRNCSDDPLFLPFL